MRAAMTRDEARKLYTDISSLVYVFGGDLRQKCLQRGLICGFSCSRFMADNTNKGVSLSLK